MRCFVVARKEKHKPLLILIILYSIWNVFEFSNDKTKDHRSPSESQISGGNGTDEDGEINASSSTLIDINHHSSLVAENILSIQHNPSKASIEVHLKKNRSCTWPFFRGRLSGRHLSIIKWEKTNQYSRSHNTTDGAGRTDLEKNSLIGHYQVPSSGEYFLEIIMLLCNSTSVLSASHSNLRYTNACLEDPKEYQITSVDAHIMVSAPYRDYDTDLGFGSWSYYQYPVQDQLINVTTTSTNSAEDHNGDAGKGQIFTRFQPPDCRDEKARKAPPCAQAMSLKRFDPFQFHWNAKTELALESLPSLVRENELVCVVGWSHARYFQQYFRKISKIPLAWHKARRTRDINENFVANMFDSNCTKIVFSLGQWDALEGLSFDDWHDKVSSIIALAAARNENRRAAVDDEVGISVTANHYNPLGDVKLTCVPQDFRSPPFIDVYNSISREICRSTKECTFVDTNTAVIGPMWDSAPDFCHYVKPSSAGKVEVSFVLGVIFGLFESE
mmetsp:Transcript_17722/g.26245  ORF Transcript_17722/g.26245 Transcript_17722/m.26245 type:complete len:501 (+) Transcript_17722:174-1676(+)|eukprot:CAMPEP_0194213542 /NCGR_PEP_ID=MMETSP0156-20130528/14227_1 /TAXON_ID=33649 /ORGANISM="Thalassionema nitzschioides, Strain L26-B" /LENGTH=500 /DNA_ID=CAMNT_0038941595 /DNA_START=156 /DNA_END=1658 /DNA_ORIENTATION=+